MNPEPDEVTRARQVEYEQIIQAIAGRVRVPGRAMPPPRDMQEGPKMAETPTPSTTVSANPYRIHGRGCGAPVVRIDAEPDRIGIRVDDDVNPEFWFQMELTALTLIEYLERCSVLEDGKRGARLMLLQQLRASFVQ
jgi:hypothetical protein